MAVWRVRAGKDGDAKQMDIDKGVVTIRLRDSHDLMGMILKNRDTFSGDLKAELPFTRVRTLVLEQ